jgi:hypothetical protein
MYYTDKFHIDIEGRKVYVHRKFLKATLNISKKKTLYTVQYETEINNGKPVERGKTESCIKTPGCIICDGVSLIKLTCCAIIL